MKGFVEIPKEWLGMEGGCLLGNLNINVNHIVSYYHADTGKYLDLSDGKQFRISAPMVELEKKIQEALNE